VQSQREYASPGCRLKYGHAHCTAKRHANQVQYVEPQEDHTFLSPLFP